ncbi:MAG: excinuclease ABC subunit UvrA, partial [Bacteroidales bacterium]|nr:excinuclease ABC subunit UvrA [Bacteroidales bacterium]
MKKKETIEEIISEETHLCVEGARVHNLKNINVRIPRYALVVITGLSGSGKSSLAFDTIYAEGQRRYMETFSAYARQFIGNMERPDVDKITGLSPVISIEQKTVNKNPRSTVGTITEIYDFLRLLFARASDAYSYETGELMQKFSEKQIFERIISTYQDKEISILAPLVMGRKGHYRELFEQIRKQGFVKVRVDGEVKEITLKMQVERYKIHDIEIVIDQIKINDSANARLNSSLQTAMKHGKGMMQVLDHETNKIRNFSRFLMCPTTGISYPEPEPNLFSFNSPYGACPKCNGLGKVTDIDLQKIIPNASKSIKNGGIEPLGSYKNNWIFRQIEALGEKYRFDISQPIEDLSDEVVNIILYGSDDIIRVKTDYAGTSSSYSMTFQGVVNFIQSQDIEGASASIKRWVESFMVKRVCDECNGSRLKKEALFFKIDHKNISE